MSIFLNQQTIFRFKYALKNSIKKSVSKRIVIRTYNKINGVGLYTGLIRKDMPYFTNVKVVYVDSSLYVLLTRCPLNAILIKKKKFKPKFLKTKLFRMCDF